MISPRPSRRRQKLQSKGLPTHEQIHLACKQIRSEWPSQVSQKRAMPSLSYASDRRFEAHLKFMEFLIARANSDQ